MQALIIEAQDDTPRVILDKENNMFELSGKSLPEDVLKFYQPVYEWLNQYILSPNDETIFKLKIDYFNSASHKAINYMLEILAEIQQKGKKVEVKWHYLTEDEDMLETGHDFEELTGLKFDFIGYV
ncbi:MAG: DUF1987 domain-containing protein [Bacteroidales bacterium]|nr:DUF1987 domain-containing protein [Bacteroidales bacterium]